MLAVVHVLGSMLMLFSVTYLLPIVTSLIYADGLVADFIYAAIGSLVAGAGIAAATRSHKRELRSRDGFLLVTLAWVVMSATATIPLLLALPGLTFTDAFFETMSGLSTTGATVLVGLDSMAPSLNLWRHALHWYGGMGIIVLVVAILPMLGVGGMQLYKAETPGPVKNEKLTPRITQTARALWTVYLAITIACISCLKLAGMSWFDAVCHAFSTLSLGGFSTYDASVGHFDSALIEFVLIVFMILSAMNFSRHFMAWQARSLRPYSRDPEATAMLWVLGVIDPLRVLVHLVVRRVPELLDVAASRRVQSRHVRADRGLRDAGLQHLASLCADGHRSCCRATRATPGLPAAASRCFARWCC